MTCNACGEKPKKTCNDFTKAVIEINNPETLVLLRKVVIPASMGTEEQVPPVVGKYHNTLLYYEASNNSYLYSSDGIPTKVTGPKGEQGPEGPAGRDGRDGRDGAIQYTAGTGIDISESNVISATGSASISWGDINGSISNQTDLSNALAAKQNTLTAGANITIDANNEISATDTTYSNFTGTDGNTGGTAGLVPAPATTDAGKFLKADGTWDTAGGGGGPTVVQTTGTSTIDVMSQNATTSMVYADPATKLQVQVGDSANGASTYAVAIGANSKASNRCVAIGGGSSLVIERTRATGDDCVALGAGAQADDSYSTAVGGGARAGGQCSLALGYGSTSPATYSYAIALGAGARTAHTGEMNIGTGAGSGNGYNSSDYRLISGVYDPQNAHDAATKGYVDSITPTITMQTTDPGEGAPLAANNFIGVYE